MCFKVLSLTNQDKKNFRGIHRQPKNRVIKISVPWQDYFQEIE